MYTLTQSTFGKGLVVIEQQVELSEIMDSIQTWAAALGNAEVHILCSKTDLGVGVVPELLAIAHRENQRTLFLRAVKS